MHITLSKYNIIYSILLSQIVCSLTEKSSNIACRNVAIRSQLCQNVAIDPMLAYRNVEILSQLCQNVATNPKLISRKWQSDHNYYKKWQLTQSILPKQSNLFFIRTPHSQSQVHHQDHAFTL